MFELVAPLVVRALTLALQDRGIRAWVRLEFGTRWLDQLEEFRRRLDRLCRTKGW